MSERDLIKELKAQITDLTADRDDALSKIKSKESRMKQVMIKLEHATSDVQATGHKIGEQNKRIADLEAKLETKTRLLDEALERIKVITDDSTENTDSDTTG
jgi:predicted  nucleic acid-binding Zn-ribbon protein|tara:strand:- start:511 stop:816 length:306 start_codon:yes stop_codon:yes gene_type:complete